MEVTHTAVADIAREADDRLTLWAKVLESVKAHRVAEIGVYRGAYAAHVLDACPAIETYYMIDPWRHLDDWNKPANRAGRRLRALLRRDDAEDARRTREKRVVLRGRTLDVIDQIPDASLDFAYIDGDHTLRGITLDLVAAAGPKCATTAGSAATTSRRSIWQHGPRSSRRSCSPSRSTSPRRSARGSTRCPLKQFLIDLGAGAFELVDLTGKYATTDLLSQVRPRARQQAAQPPPERSPKSRARARLAGVLRARRG